MLPHACAHCTEEDKGKEKGSKSSSPFLHTNMPELFTPALTGSKIWPQGILSQAVWNKRYIGILWCMILEKHHTLEKALSV